MTEDSPGRNERLVHPFDGLPSMIKAYMSFSTDAHGWAIGLPPPEAMGKIKVTIILCQDPSADSLGDIGKAQHHKPLQSGEQTAGLAISCPAIP